MLKVQREMAASQVLFLIDLVIISIHITLSPPICSVNSFPQSNRADVQGVDCSVCILRKKVNDEIIENKDLADNEGTLLLRKEQTKLFKVKLLKYIF